MGVTPKDSTKGRGYMAHGYLFRYRSTQDAAYLHKAEACLDWLDHHKPANSRSTAGATTSIFSSRKRRLYKDDPIIVWTCLIGFAYLEAYELTGEKAVAGIADSACGWIMDLPASKRNEVSCISYYAHAQCSIHNSNMLGRRHAGPRTARHTGNAA